MTRMRRGAARAIRFAALAAIAAATDALIAQTPSAGRRILFDEAHHNLMATAADGYRPFVVSITDAGFAITTNVVPFTASRLTAVDILAVVHANGAEQRAPVQQRAETAFTTSEVDVVHDWVRAGGGLLVVTDHYPAAPAAQRLLARFGVTVSSGWTDDPDHRRSLGTYGPVFGYLVFSRPNGMLVDHPIREGRDPSERISAVASTTGTSLQGPAGSTPLLRLGDNAADWLPPSTPRPALPAPGPRDFNPCPTCDTVSAAGRAQGIAFEAGRGRVVVLGEMGILIDYATADTDNRQFAINVVRWLAREL